MERLHFSAGQQVLWVTCADGRTDAPTLMDHQADLNSIRRPGGILAPHVGAKDDARLLGVLEQNFLEEILLMKEIKQPVAIVIVTHAHCAAQQRLGVDDSTLRARVAKLIQALAIAGVDIPIYAVHDDHCVHGRERAFRLFESINLQAATAVAA